jgi:hypothetical protein
MGAIASWLFGCSSNAAAHGAGLEGYGHGRSAGTQGIEESILTLANTMNAQAGKAGLRIRISWG